MPGAKARIRLDGADPINRGRVGAWFFNGLPSAIEDIGPRRMRATPTSTLASAGLTTKGRALSFSAAAPVAYSATNYAPAQTRYSMIAWIRPNFASSGGADHGVLGRFAEASIGTNRAFLRWDNPANGWYLDDLSGAVGWAYRTSAATPAFSAGDWGLLAFTYNGAAGGGQFWWNGRTVTTGAVNTSNSAAPLTGVPFNLARGWNGHILMASFYDRVILPAEIGRFYRDPWAGTGRQRLPLPFVYPPLSATIDATVPITAQITAALQPFDVGGDTHDGLKRSRRLRRIEALRQRAEAERLADAQALRLALEAALGVAAELPTDNAPRVAEAVQRAPKPAEVDWRRVADDAEQYARLSRVVSRLSAVVQAEAKRRADEDDDDDAAFLLGIA